MKGKCVCKEQCLNYPATEIYILTLANSGVPIPNVGACRKSHFMFCNYEVSVIEGKDASCRYAHIITVQFVFNSS